MNIPVFHVKHDTLPGAWEHAVFAVHDGGIGIPSQHDREGDPPTLDCTMTMTVLKPMQEPRVHRCLPVGLDGLSEYVDEVIHGLHDERHDGWGYSYWRRLRKYLAINILPIKDVSECGLRAIGVDQVQVMIDRLSECSYTRRAQAITWMPAIDNEIDDPPCLQRIWARLLPDEKDCLWLNMNAHFRSNDALKAGFMNLFVLSEIQSYMAKEIGARIERPVLCGRLVNMIDSFHLYGKYFLDGDFSKFEHGFQTRDFADRTWNSDRVKR